MPNFWDLPRPVRDKIYRLHLVLPDQPVSVATHISMCHYSGNMPPLLKISDRADDEAAPIYYGENHFTFDSDELHRITMYTYQHHFPLLRRVTFDWNPEASYMHYRFEALAQLKNLQELNIKVDERKMVHAGLVRRDVRQSTPKEKAEYSAQEQLAIYRFPGMTGLLSLRGIPTVNFLARKDLQGNEVGGTIPNGILLTQVLPLMTAPEAKAKGNGKGKGKSKARKTATDSKTRTKKSRRCMPIHFDFLGLPAEMRNWIYEMVLCIGPINPSKKPPSSASYAGKKVKHEIPQSALSLLAVNKQIRTEAIGIYASAPLVFFYPTQFHAFYIDCTKLRRKVTKDITIHHETTKRGGIDLVDLSFPLIRKMHGLQRLHIILEGTLLLKIRPPRRFSTEYQMRDANPGLLPGMKVLFTLRGLTDIKIRDNALEEAHEKLLKDNAYPSFDTKSRSYHIVKLTAALEHFNAALLLAAQTGMVSEELLEDNEWHTKDVFPELPEEESGDEAEEADGYEEGDGTSKAREPEQQASEAGVVTDAEVTAGPVSAATATTGTRRSARISDRLAKAQLVVDYNEDNEDDIEQEQEENGEEEDDIDEDMEVHRGRAASVEL